MDISQPTSTYISQPFEFVFSDSDSDSDHESSWYDFKDSSIYIHFNEIDELIKLFTLLNIS
jgi:hypothetical protein